MRVSESGLSVRLKITVCIGICYLCSDKKDMVHKSFKCTRGDSTHHRTLQPTRSVDSGLDDGAQPNCALVVIMQLGGWQRVVALEGCGRGLHVVNTTAFLTR